VENVAAKKEDTNIFLSPASLKRWSIDLSDACGSVITNTPPSIKEIDKLVDKFVIDYNYHMSQKEEPTT
tara:strand:- start:6089 stop:6295 length:207 start_codon:yes stop_codon:yes gene_type:complete